MLISESWLRQRVNPNISTDELAERLTLAGLEVASVEPVTALSPSKKIVVGEIVSMTKHPDADKLNVCEVNIGKKKPLSIICGAANAEVGIKIPVALVGTKLPKVVIKKAAIRGMESSGMLCSAAELGLEEVSSGLMILDDSADIGQSAFEYLNLGDSGFRIGTHSKPRRLFGNGGDSTRSGGINVNIN